MAQRATTKAKRGSAPRDSVSPFDSSGPAGSAALEIELKAVKAELAAARARIAELEAGRADVLNRIDWVIDSLHNLRDR